MNVSGTTFPSRGTPTVPTQLADACGGAPALPGYVALQERGLERLPSASSSRGATKSGRKFNDLQGDGVNESSDPGLGGWEIRAYADDDPQNGVLDEAELAAGPVATTTTSDSGAYSFTLEPGSYIICEVQQAGWTQTFPTGAPAECDVDPSLGAQGYAVTLAAGENDPGNAFGNREPEPERVTVNICHATGEEPPCTRRWSPEILVDGALKGDEFDDHREHAGDIIPPYSYFDANGEQPRVRRPELGDRHEARRSGSNDCVPPPEPPPPIPTRSPRPPSASSCWQAGASAPTSGTTTRTARPS